MYSKKSNNSFKTILIYRERKIQYHQKNNYKTKSLNGKMPKKLSKININHKVAMIEAMVLGKNYKNDNGLRILLKNTNNK